MWLTLLMVLAGIGGFAANLLWPISSSFKISLYLILALLVFALIIDTPLQLFAKALLTAGSGAAAAEFFLWLQSLNKH